METREQMLGRSWGDCPECEQPARASKMEYQDWEKTERVKQKTGAPPEYLIFQAEKLEGDAAAKESAARRLRAMQKDMELGWEVGEAVEDIDTGMKGSTYM